MKITKDKIMGSSISIGALIVILPVFFWVFNKADKKEIKEAEEKIQYEHDINIKQTAILDNIFDKMELQKESTDKELNRLYERIGNE